MTNDEMFAKLADTLVQALVARIITNADFMVKLAETVDERITGIPDDLESKIQDIIEAKIGELSAEDIRDFEDKVAEIVNSTLRDDSDSIIKDALAEQSIDADDIHGLDSFVERMLEDIEVEASNINGLDSEIEEKLNALSASDISDLDDYITEQMKNNDSLTNELAEAIATKLQITTK